MAGLDSLRGVGHEDGQGKSVVRRIWDTPREDLGWEGGEGGEIGGERIPRDVLKSFMDMLVSFSRRQRNFKLEFIIPRSVFHSFSTSAELDAQLFNGYIQGLFGGMISPALKHLSRQMIYAGYGAYEMGPLKLPFHDLINHPECTLVTLDQNMWLGTAFSKGLSLFDSLETLGIAARREWRPEWSEGDLAEPTVIPCSLTLYVGSCSMPQP
ncbi:hypothetical protein PM082_009660 [Marasmius tenuissimus]|nr:hypothetical protein PM082_009660 [Marasmius tenuissimus]